MLKQTLIAAALILICGATEDEIWPEFSELNLIHTYLQETSVPYFDNKSSQTDNENYGDIIFGLKGTNDILLSREILHLSLCNRTYMKKWVGTSSKYIINHVRFFNLGRERAHFSSFSIKKYTNSTAEVKFVIDSSTEPRIWLESYGRNGSKYMPKPWFLFLSIMYVFKIIL